ncbi:MAG: hypothetical protein AAB884_02590, partial [Patescibacteria group bacterium]
GIRLVIIDCLPFGFSFINIHPMRPVIRGPVSFVRYVLWRTFELIQHLYLMAGTGYRKGIFTQDILCVARKSSKSQI